MKRLVLSLLGGVLIPFGYTLIIGPLSLYIKSARLNYLLWSLIGWPKILYFYFFPPLSPRAPPLADDTFFIIMIACNIALYGSLTYCVLLLRSLGKPQPQTAPPPPPIFTKTD